MVLVECPRCGRRWTVPPEAVTPGAELACLDCNITFAAPTKRLTPPPSPPLPRLAVNTGRDIGEAPSARTPLPHTNGSRFAVSRRWHTTFLRFYGSRVCPAGVILVVASCLASFLFIFQETPANSAKMTVVALGISTVLHVAAGMLILYSWALALWLVEAGEHLKRMSKHS
jgi:hypothetical protein